MEDAPILGPVHSVIVHFVDDHDQQLHTKGLCQQSVLTCLSAPLKARLELALSGGNDLQQHSHARDTLSAHNHH